MTDPTEVYTGLRDMVLQLDPARAGFRPDASAAEVWGIVIDMGNPSGVATLVGLADGTTSIYTSTGGGMIGGGGHESVRSATQRWLRGWGRTGRGARAGRGVPPP